MDEAVASKVELSPIGVFHSDQVAPYEAGRQPDEHHSEGVIELANGRNFEQALIGLDGCPRIWVIFQFHHNTQWNPMVMPPRGRATKIGVFATRSPHRPSGIGMSCVRILKIDKLRIHVAGADILDGSPILDIKPYVAYADSFPDTEPEWLKDAKAYRVVFSAATEERLQWLESRELSQLRGFLQHQLEFEPMNSKKKRVKVSGDGFVIAYKTWRASFIIQENALEVQTIFSGYDLDDFVVDDDPYGDKDLHREFMTLFPSLI